MKYATLLLALAACGDESKEEPITAPVINWLSIGVMHEDATSYRLAILTWDTAAPSFAYTDIWNPTAMGPTADVFTIALKPSSTTIRHYFEIKDLAGYIVDQSPMFTFAGGSAVIYCRINGGKVYWSTNTSGPWN